jgi:hypothetical protein
MRIKSKQQKQGKTSYVAGNASRVINGQSYKSEYWEGILSNSLQMP